ncbi:hypothetical protein C8Q80DRAFT_1214900 [Daedaleopsis nitida]|nr:hypothetical protein C8Q80DRAFT_1214900 [Daedaleopsis nitida]
MGVKSLWQLLDPVGRPVLLETMEGKSMAIDSSIWIYQFQATMRDKEGRGLVNAHVVGFLRRICKLLFYGIKPVFVFDGGAPALKMATIAERKKKKSGAAASHAKVAERLLAAHMRREAVEHAVANTKEREPKGKQRPPPGRIDENTVYLEDLSGPGPAPKTPAKHAESRNAQSSPSPSKKARWRDHDPYRLPDMDLHEVVAKATATAVPDPRLATEDELRAFIEEMRPEDFDVASPAFRELPTEVQYEIIGDLRLKSRQTSYKRLQSMLKTAKTPLDFSKEQIKNLKQRNSLTQQLLVTTDSIGKAHITIPVRIASERNKEYVLVKNEGADGGWVLGIRDEGTAEKPIEIDPPPAQVESDEDEDDDMEEVPIAITSTEPYDPDLREFRREQTLSAVGSRYKPKQLAPLTTRLTRKPARPLFEPEDDDVEQLDPGADNIEDPELQFAISESIEVEEEASLRRAIEESKKGAHPPPLVKNGESSRAGANMRATPDRRRSQQVIAVRDDSDDEDLYASPTRLETALSIAGAGPRRPSVAKVRPSSSMFGVPSLLLPQGGLPSPVKQTEVSVAQPFSQKLDDLLMPIQHVQQGRSISTSEVQPVLTVETPSKPATGSSSPERTIAIAAPTTVEDSDDDMEEVVPIEPPRHPPPISNRMSTEQSLANTAVHFSLSSPSPSASVHSDPSASVTAPSLPTTGSLTPPVAPPNAQHPTREAQWSRPPSPTGDPSRDRAAEDEGWDAAQEIDPHAEEDEYTRFVSQVKGKDIDAVRREIDEEIRELNKQKKNALRDSEDITQQMVSQIMIMLRLFGIPYITAPMEAEAQCAALLSLGLVDGIITDDSDVFLFGGGRVLKNMFNQSKTVECYLLSDLERELGLDRDKLVRLAYLLGSDYTDGLPGVGPVVAMELLSEFPDRDGLHKFKAWWTKVQSGRDAPEESASRFRKRFKQKFKALYLHADWPNPQWDAYYHPTVDDSSEPFNYFDTELGWDQAKVDELLLPIIRKMNKRSQSGSSNMQGNLAGLRKQAPAAVVSDFRKQQAQLRSSNGPDADDHESGSDLETETARPAKKRKKSDDAKSKTKTKGKAKAKALSDTAGEEGTTTATRGARGLEGSAPHPDGPTPMREELGLRPRPKPRPVYKPPPPATQEEGSVDTD